MRYHCTSVRMTKILNTDKTKCWWDIKPQEFSYIAIGNTKWDSLWEDSLSVPYKTTQRTVHAFWCLSQGAEIISTQNSVYSRFIYNFPNLEAAKTSFNRWMNKYNKLWHIQIIEYFWGNFILFSLLAEEFTFPPTAHKGSLIAISLPTVVCSCLFNNLSNRCAVISYCGFILHSPDD